MSAPGDGEGDAGSASVQPPPRPRLKINISRSGSSFVGIAADKNGVHSLTPAAPLTSAISSDGTRRVKLKASTSQSPTPATPLTATTKAGRQTKPTQKLVESKKRPGEEDEDQSGGGGIEGPPRKVKAVGTKIKLRPTTKAATTQLVLKPRGRLPVHPPGDGYDSEASDRELDPAIEEQIIFRMLPGEHCDYIRWCMDNGKIGLPHNQGSADLTLKFFEEESRRAVVNVQGQPYAAVLVDLPTITEAMKTWDKKSFMKSADICQMLLVFQKVKDEAEACTAPLPATVPANFKWPHGLTPPMHDCVNRRFAKTVSRKDIEDKEAEVERLMAEDAKAMSTTWEWVDERSRAEPEEDEDAEGEVDDGGLTSFYSDAAAVPDDEGSGNEEIDDGDLEADLEAAFADDVAAATPVTGAEPSTPQTLQPETPAPLLRAGIEQLAGLEVEVDDEDDGDDDDDDDDDEDDDDENLDEDERARREEEQGVREIINDLQKQLAKRVQQLEKTTNKILRQRLETQIKQFKSELQLKKSSIGMETDD